jgi:hypothetical protein
MIAATYARKSTDQGGPRLHINEWVTLSNE